MSAQIYLRVKWKVKQFEVFQERSFQSMALDEERLAVVKVVQHGASNRLFRIADGVVNVNHRIPVLSPVDRFRVLRKKHSDEINQINQSKSQPIPGNLFYTTLTVTWGKITPPQHISGSSVAIDEIPTSIPMFSGCPTQRCYTQHRRKLFSSVNPRWPPPNRKYFCQDVKGTPDLLVNDEDCITIMLLLY